MPRVDGADLRDRPLLARKRILRRLMPLVVSRLLHVDHLQVRGGNLFRAACDVRHGRQRREVCRGTYQRDGIQTSWIKIKNRSYSQAEGRREFFEQRSDRTRPGVSRRAPMLAASRDTDD